MVRLILSLLLVSFASLPLLAQWAPRAPGSVDLLEWREIPGDEGRIYLFRNGCQIGGWDYHAQHWRDYDAARDVWSPPAATPPVAPPARGTPNFGVDPDKLGNGARFELNGQRVSKQQVFDALQDKIPEDAKKLRVTVIGSAVERQRVIDAYASLEASLRERLTLWSVPPDHWSLTDTTNGTPIFRTDGKPTLYVQAPDGKVLHRQDDFAGAQDLEAIRKAVKNYDASRDPDLRKPAPTPLPPAPAPSPQNLPLPGIALMLGVLGYLFLRRRSV